MSAGKDADTPGGMVETYDGVGNDALNDRTLEVAQAYQHARGRFRTYCEGDNYRYSPARLKRWARILQTTTAVSFVRRDWVRSCRHQRSPRHATAQFS